MNESDILTKLRQELRRLRYKQSTINSYLSAGRLLFEFFPDRDPKELKKQDFVELIDYLIERRHWAPATVHQAMMAIRFLYAKVFKLPSHSVRTVPLPTKKRKVPNILEPKEIIDILNAINNPKHRVLLMVIYASGLKVTEALRLRSEDIDTRKKLLSVRSADGRLIRRAVLSEEFNKQLQDYIATHRPVKWLFPARNENFHLADRSAQHIFDTAAMKAGITKDVSVKDLRHAFAGHLLQTGHNLETVQRALGLRSYASAQFYEPLTGGKAIKFRSPLDIYLSGHSRVSSQTADLEILLHRIRNEDEREYLREAITCFDASAYRAGVVFVWTAAILNIQTKCFTKRDELNSHLQNAHAKSKDKPRIIHSMDDFAYFKDKTILLASQEIGVYIKAERETLEQCLSLRNRCGHPTRYSPKFNEVAAFLDQAVDLVFAR